MTATVKNWFDRHGRVLAVVLLVVVGLVVYANALPNKMFWDDDDSITNNVFVHDWHYIPQYFSRDLIAGSQLLDNYWRPMLLLVYSVEWHLWQGWSPGFHAVNVLCHIGDAVLLYFVLWRIFKDRRLAWLTALIFLVHPLQTEAVTYVAGLGDPLSVLFMLIGIDQFLKWRESGRPFWSSGRTWLVLAMYALALMSKETAIVMPAYVVLADVFRAGGGGQKEPGLGRRLKAAALAAIPFLVLAGVYLLLRATVLNFLNTFNLYNETNAFTSHFSYRLFTFCRVLTIYAGLLFVPLGLHMERTVAVATSLLHWDVIVGALIFLGLLALACYSCRRRPVVAFGLFWIFAGLAPTSNLAVPINGLIYEHWLYLPLVGAFLPLVWLGLRAARGLVSRGMLAAVYIVFVVWLLVLTMARNPVWHDPIVFYHDVLRYNQSSYRIYNNLGNAYSALRDAAAAGENYQQAIALDPDNPVAYFNLANTLRDSGQIDQAIADFQKAVELGPTVHFYANNLAALYLQLGRRRDARQVLENYVAHAAYKNNALLSLAVIAAQDKDFDGALRYLDQAAAADPSDARVANLRQQVLQAQGQPSP